MQLTEQQALDERQKYVEAFNKTMIAIWQERITLLDAIDTGALLQSTTLISMRADGRYIDLSIDFAFRQYGIYVDRGTGGDTPRGNGGDLGHAKGRQPKPWFHRKYLASVFNLRDFYADNLGQEFCGILSDAFNGTYGSK